MRMDHSRRQKYENKQSKNSILEKENDFEPISISINDMDKFKKRTGKEKKIYKNLLVRLVEFVN